VVGAAPGWFTRAVAATRPSGAKPARRAAASWGAPMARSAGETKTAAWRPPGVLTEANAEADMPRVGVVNIGDAPGLQHNGRPDGFKYLAQGHALADTKLPARTTAAGHRGAASCAAS